MKKIKIITRNGMPETNSSSSHSVTISGKQNNSNPKLCNLKVDPDNILRITNIIGGFGWDWSKYNDSYSKALYVAGLCESDGESKGLLVEVLREVTGAKKVIFTWENHSHEEAPNIDHQSLHEMYSLICENKETIKDFIFNQDSWLFTGNDNDSAPTGFYEEKEKLETQQKVTWPANMIIHFSAEVGDFTISLSDLSDPGVVIQETRDTLEEWVDVHSQDKVVVYKSDSGLIPEKTATFANIIGDEVIFILRSEYISKLQEGITGDIVDKILQENNPNYVFRFKYTVITDEFGNI